jgi:transcriptional regulator with XRE-family HTH domain
MSLPAEIPDALPELRNRATRERLGRVVVALLDHWGLNPADQASLLGLSAQSRSTVARYRKGEPLADSADLLARAGHLLGIHKALRIMFPHDLELAYRWVGTPNRRFGDVAPLEVMKKHGYEGILAVRRYLDFERGR